MLDLLQLMAYVVQVVFTLVYFWTEGDRPVTSEDLGIFALLVFCGFFLQFPWTSERGKK